MSECFQIQKKWIEGLNFFYSFQYPTVEENTDVESKM